MNKQMCVCRAERVAGDGGGLGAEILRIKSDGSAYRAPNIDPSRSHLNRSIVDCGGRGGNAIRAAIDRRIREAGVTRKVTADQCRAVVMYLSGTHDQMAQLEAEGRLDEWAEDCRAWLAEQWGEDNIVALELHRDEYTPHLHAVIVPITTEARRRRGREDERRRYQVRPKVRLSADHYLSKSRMRGWQDSYAAAMAKYGLERGVAGSRARHQSMNEYYRHLQEERIPEAEQTLRAKIDLITAQTETLDTIEGELQAKLAKMDDVERTIGGLVTAWEAAKSGVRGRLGGQVADYIEELYGLLQQARNREQKAAKNLGEAEELIGRKNAEISVYKRLAHAVTNVYPRAANIVVNLDTLERLGLPLQVIRELYRDGAIRYSGVLRDYTADEDTSVTDLLIEIASSTAGEMLVWLDRMTPSAWLEQWRRGAAGRERREIYERRKAEEESRHDRRPSLDDILTGRIRRG